MTDDVVLMLRRKIHRRKGTWPIIAREAGIDYFTLVRFAHGTHKPLYSTVAKIAGYFDKQAAGVPDGK